MPPAAAAATTAEDLALKFGEARVEDLIGCVSIQEAREDFAKLLAAPPALGMHRQGMKANEHCAAEHVFRAHRVVPHNGVHRPTLYAVWATPRLKDKLLAAAARMCAARGIAPDRVRARHLLTAYKLQHGCISLFRPMVAKYLFSAYSKRGRVLDFCAGWGGRLLGALACPGVVSYVGVDSNPEMAGAYRAIIDLFGGGGKEARVLCSAAEAVDFSAVGRFDCVVTSPPYYGVEVYRGQPAYESYEDWLATFLLPTLRGLTRHIDQDGVVCINIRQPETERRMVAEMARLGWAVRETLLMRLPAMPGKGSRKADKLYGEPIYVFSRSSLSTGGGGGGAAVVASDLTHEAQGGL